jgi:arsenate reductase
MTKQGESRLFTNASALSAFVIVDAGRRESHNKHEESCSFREKSDSSATIGNFSDVFPVPNPGFNDGVPMLKVMFLCTGNSCRSQMADGFARTHGQGLIESHSAGLLAAGVHRRAIAVMQEAGIDISRQRSREIDPDLLGTMDVVITLCDKAAEACPRTPPSIKRLHWPVKDPVGTVGTEMEIMKEFRRAREEIREKVEGLIRGLPPNVPTSRP